MHPWHSLGGLEKGENTITKTQRFLSFILQHAHIYIQRKKGAENHHVIETYKFIILHQHLKVTLPTPRVLMPRVLLIIFFLNRLHECLCGQLWPGDDDDDDDDGKRGDEDEDGYLDRDIPGSF